MLENNINLGAAGAVPDKLITMQYQEKEYTSLDRMWDFSKDLRNLMNEVQYLREENQNLKEELEKYQEWHNKAFEDAQKNMGQALKACLELGQRLK